MGQSRIPEVAGAAAPPSKVCRIASEAEASELAHRLLTPGRQWPVAVLTLPTGFDEPFGDPDELKEAVGAWLGFVGSGWRRKCQCARPEQLKVYRSAQEDDDTRAGTSDASTARKPTSARSETHRCGLATVVTLCY
ncbi:hypothetical protein [Micromonospora sp. NPDC048839]|uniref:hypothetical protein n=1 Tax=Micromonospora sp. NPDC048839 TaxID=3155641 RepID=UPI0033D095DD